MAKEEDTEEFKELKIDSMIEHDSSSSTEFWLIQWPFDQSKKDRSNAWPKLADFDGQEATLKLNSDDQLGSIQSSAGKSYELRSLQSYTPDEVVYLSSASDNKIVGKISRHVSLIHYPEASELQKPDKDMKRKLGLSYTTSLSGSGHRSSATPTQTIRSRPSTGPTPTRSRKSGGSSSILTGSLEPSKSKKRKHTSEPSASRGHSDRDSSRGHSTVTTSGGSLNQSQESKSKKNKKTEG